MARYSLSAFGTPTNLIELMLGRIVRMREEFHGNDGKTETQQASHD
jgi:hypothetical protein